jgi:hypothetical protein
MLSRETPGFFLLAITKSDSGRIALNSRVNVVATHEMLNKPKEKEYGLEDFKKKNIT